MSIQSAATDMSEVGGCVSNASLLNGKALKALARCLCLSVFQAYRVLRAQHDKFAPNERSPMIFF